MRRLVVAALFTLMVVAGLSCSSDKKGSTDVGDGGVTLPDGKFDGGGDVKVAPADAGDTQTVADSGNELPNECQGEALICLSDKEVGQCKFGKWETFAICPATHFCASGTCIEPEACEPGLIDGCASLTSIKQCNEEGTAFIPVECPVAQQCCGGVCGVLECLPGKVQCVDNKTTQSCLNDCSGWGPPEPCPSGLTCVGGKCMSECLSDPKWNNSYIGCEYWSLDLDNYHDPTTPQKPDEVPHGLVLSNPGNAAATVTFTSFASDVDFNLLTATIEPGESQVVEMPRMDVDGSTITDRSVRINSNRPIVAYQFNPLDFQATYSDDSSLLIPAEMLGKEYLILTYPTSPLEAVSFPGFDFESQHGYFAVLAVEQGETNVSVRVTVNADKPDSEDNEQLQPGAYHSFTLKQGEVLNLQADGSKMTGNTDLSGSHVTADKKVAVFAGHEEAVVQGLEVMPDGEPADCCCAEHMEEQLFPLDTWANTYLCVKARPRGGNDLDLWRVQAGTFGVQLTTDPPIPGIDGVTLEKKGDWVEAFVAGSFVVQGSGPIQVAQYLSSQTCTEDHTGDPAQIMAVASSQYRTPYAFATPKDYSEDYITVVRPVGSQTTLDNNSLADGEFSPLAGSGYEFGYFPVADGPHNIEGDQPFGLYMYGFDGPASYGNPGGLNLIKTQ